MFGLLFLTFLSYVSQPFVRVCCQKSMIWIVAPTILDFSELGFLAFCRCVLYETYDFRRVVCYFGPSELGFLVFCRYLLSVT